MAKAKHEPEQKSMTFVLDTDIADAIEELSHEEDRTKSAVARRLLRQGIASEETNKAAKK